MKLKTAWWMVPLGLACGGGSPPDEPADVEETVLTLQIPACEGVDAPPLTPGHVPELRSSLQAYTSIIDVYPSRDQKRRSGGHPYLKGAGFIAQPRDRLEGALFQDAEPLEDAAREGLLLLVKIKKGSESEMLAGLSEDIDFVSTLTIGDLVIEKVALVMGAFVIHGVDMSSVSTMSLKSEPYNSRANGMPLLEAASRLLRREPVLAYKLRTDTLTKRVQWDGTLPFSFDNGARKIELQTIQPARVEERLPALLSELDSELMRVCRRYAIQKPHEITPMAARRLNSLFRTRQCGEGCQDVREAVQEVASLVGWEHPQLQARFAWSDRVVEEKTRADREHNRALFQTFLTVGESFAFTEKSTDDREVAVWLTVESPLTCGAEPITIPDQEMGPLMQYGEPTGVDSKEVACAARARLELPHLEGDPGLWHAQMAQIAMDIGTSRIFLEDGEMIPNSLLYALGEEAVTFWITVDDPSSEERTSLERSDTVAIAIYPNKPIQEDLKTLSTQSNPGFASWFRHFFRIR